MEFRACPICRHTTITPIFVNSMLAIDSMDMSYEIGRCQHCGFHFASNLPTICQYQTYYKAASKYDVESAVSVLDHLRIEAAVNLMHQWIPKDELIVDLGCGYGALLAALRDSGWVEVYGVDPAPQSAQRAREIFGLEDVYCGTLNDVSKCIDLKRAGVVCLMAVLEHLPALREDLESLLVQLRPGARLLVEVPVIEGFCADGAEPFGEFSIEHIQFFSLASLRNLLGSLGLRVIAEQRQDLPLIASGSAFVLAEMAPVETKFRLEQEPLHVFDDYVCVSESALQSALKRVPKGPFIVYGAGSHSARLIPRMSAEVRDNITSIVDGNPNLIGKKLGPWQVQAPARIALMPQLPILISSYRAQNEIVANLRKRYPNPMVLLY